MSIITRTSTVLKLRQKLASLYEERQRLATEACTIDGVGGASLLQTESLHLIERRAHLSSKLMELDAQIHTYQMKLLRLERNFIAQ